MKRFKNILKGMAISLTVTLFLPALAATVAQAQQRPPTPVFVAPVEKVTYSDEIEALGTLQSNENVNLTSTVTERVTQINFEDNQRVSKGEILVKMDMSEEEAELAEERSRLLEAEAQLKRLRPLVARGAASQSVLDAQEREFRIARARIRAIQSRIDERRITAPFDGVVGIRNISVGALAQPGTLITTIDDNRVMKLDFEIPEVFLASLTPGIVVQARASAFPERIFAGSISSIDSRIDSITRTVMVRAILDNEEGLLKAGMLMRVSLQKNPRQALVVPEESIVTVGDESAVMVVQEGDPATVGRQVVQLGERRKGEVEILSGLQPGQKVVTHGTLRVRPGSAVIIKAIDNSDESLPSLLNQAQDRTPQINDQNNNRAN